MSTYEALRYNFSGASITALNGSNIASGTVAEARLADLATSKITSGTFADARLSSSSVTQHVDLSNLNASNLTSGTVPNARYGTPTFSAANLTNVPSAGLSTGSWSPQYRTSGGTISTSQNFAYYFQNGKIVHVNGLHRFTSSSGLSGSNARVYISNLPVTSANVSNKFASITGHHSSYGSSGSAIVFPNSTTMVLHGNVSYQGRNASPPIFTNDGTEGVYVRGVHVQEWETGTFGDSWVYFECVYFAA